MLPGRAAVGPPRTRWFPTLSTHTTLPNSTFSSARMCPGRREKIEKLKLSFARRPEKNRNFLLRFFGGKKRFPPVSGAFSRPLFGPQQFRLTRQLHHSTPAVGRRISDLQTRGENPTWSSNIFIGIIYIRDISSDWCRFDFSFSGKKRHKENER